MKLATINSSLDINTRPWRNSGPFKFIIKIYFFYVVKQILRSAENLFTISEDTFSKIISEIEKDWRSNLGTQSVSQPSLTFSAVLTVVTFKSRTFTKEKVDELLASLPSSVVEHQDESDIN